LSAQSLKAAPLKRVLAQILSDHFEKLLGPDHKRLIHETALLLVAKSVKFILLIATLIVN
jgi:hypothetical protein